MHYWCVFLSLVIQHLDCRRRLYFLLLSFCLFNIYLHNLINEWIIGEKLLNIKRVIGLSTQLCMNIFFVSKNKSARYHHKYIESFMKIVC
jgi:hypothetical protein